MFAVALGLLSIFIESVMSSTMTYKPRLIGRLPTTLPPPMTSKTPGTWAHSTMSKRIIEDIYKRLIEDNTAELTQPTSPLRSECFLVLNDLKSSVECGHGGYLRSVYDGGPDLNVWDEILSQIPEDQRNWLDAPWLISEFYFYRRIVEAFKYFETGYDMFLEQKVAGLQSSMTQIQEIASRLPTLIRATDNLENNIKTLILTSLWGNKADLSLWPKSNADGGSSSSSSSTMSAALSDTYQYILDNDIEEVVIRLLEIKKMKKSINDPTIREIGIIVDNAGYELVTDFILGYGLIKLGIIDRVIFHTKAHPTFVSDATTQDCIQTIKYLMGEDDNNIKSMATDMFTLFQLGQFSFINDLFWCQPIPFWDMTENIINKISTSQLIFVKGDANYRRLLGEREWSLITPAKDILSYWPIPVCALRTFKAEIGCGINIIQQDKAKSIDKNWMVSGKWGVIQLGSNDN